MELVRFVIFNLTAAINAPLTFVPRIQIASLKGEKLGIIQGPGHLRVYVSLSSLLSSRMINPPL